MPVAILVRIEGRVACVGNAALVKGLRIPVWTVFFGINAVSIRPLEAGGMPRAIIGAIKIAKLTVL